MKRAAGLVLAALCGCTAPRRDCATARRGLAEARRRDRLAVWARTAQGG